MESLILYKKKSPYMTESSYTETIKVYTESEIVDVIKGPTNITTIHVGSGDTESAFTLTSQDSLVTYSSGYSSYTMSTIIRAYEDKTKNCKLTMEDLDKNFLTLKDYDISGGTFDEGGHSLILVRNNGEIINVPVINPYTGNCHCDCVSDIKLSGSVDDNHNLVLNYLSADGEKTVYISGLTIVNSGTTKDETNYLATETPNIDKTSSYKNVKAIVDELPCTAKNGDRYLLKQKVSSFGRLYDEEAMKAVENELNKHHIVWHIPSLEEWAELFDYVEPCDTTGTTASTFAGLALKSDVYWNGKDKYSFSAVPNDINEDEMRRSYYWASSKSTGDTNYDGVMFTDADAVEYSAVESENEYRSIRLMCYYDRDIRNISVNILGTDYKVIQIGNQYWLDTNLNYAVNGSEGIDYETIDEKYSGTSENKMFIAYYENNMWEQKELVEGDDVWVNIENGMQEYYVAKNIQGEYTLMPLVTMTPNEKNEIISRYNSGWY